MKPAKSFHSIDPQVLLRVLCLASLLTAASVFADAGTVEKYPIKDLNIKAWLPDPPVPGSAAQASDVATFWSYRALLQTTRGMEAARDDVYDAASIWARFADATGVVQGITIEHEAPAFVALINKAQNNGEDLLAPIKRPTNDGGRVRPFIAFPGAPTCIEPVDLVAGHRDHDYQYGLKTSGSYPSGHSFRGMLWALLLAEMLPDHADAIMERGIAFGESRVVCGFHYPSDVAAARLAAAALLADLRANAEFQKDFAQAAIQIRKLVAAHGQATH